MLAWIKEWLLTDTWLLPSFFSFCFAFPLSNYPLIIFHNAKKQPRYPNEEGSAWFLYHCILAYDRGCFCEYICLNSLFRSWIHRFMHVSKRPFMLDFVNFFSFLNSLKNNTVSQSSHKFAISSPDMNCWIAEYIVCFLVINAFIIFKGVKLFFDTLEAASNFLKL